MAFRNPGKIIADILETSDSGKRVIIHETGSGGIVEMYSGLPGEHAATLEMTTTFDAKPQMFLRSGYVIADGSLSEARLQLVPGDTSENQLGTSNGRCIQTNCKLVVPGAIFFQGDLVTQDWTRAVLAAGWDHYDDVTAPGGVFFRVQYKLIGNTLILRGLIKRTGANVPANAVMFTLPVGFRPQRLQSYATVMAPIGTEINSSLLIAANGDVSASLQPFNTGGYCYINAVVDLGNAA